MNLSAKPFEAGVAGCTLHMLDSVLFGENLELLGSELGPIVRHKQFWDPMRSKPLSQNITCL